jgi:hypothetical protein
MMDKLWDCQSKLALAEAAIDAVIETDHNKIGTAPGSLEEWNHMEGHRCAAIPCIKYRQRWPKEDRG